MAGYDYTVERTQARAFKYTCINCAISLVDLRGARLGRVHARVHTRSE